MSGAVVNGGFHDDEAAKINGRQQQVKVILCFIFEEEYNCYL